MKFKCKISGVIYDDGILSFSGCQDSIHPIFNLESRTLVSFARQLQATPHSDNYYLVGLAIFNQLSPRYSITIDRESAIKNIVPNFERMTKLIFAIDPSHRHRFPNFVIDKNNNDFSQLSTWLDTIDAVFTEIKSNARELALAQKVLRIEAILDRYLNSKINKHQNKIAQTLAEWADLVCEFPTSEFYTATSKTTTKLYWKDLIIQSFKNSYADILASGIDYDDFLDLHDYLEFNIPHGSSHAHMLMAKIRKTKDILEEFTRPKTTPKIVYEKKGVDILSLLEDRGMTVNDMAGAVAGALAVANNNSFHDVSPIDLQSYNPGPEPKAKDYPNKVLHMRAKLKWLSEVATFNRMKLQASESDSNISINDI